MIAKNEQVGYRPQGGGRYPPWGSFRGNLNRFKQGNPSFGEYHEKYRTIRPTGEIGTSKKSSAYLKITTGKFICISQAESFWSAKV